MEEYKISLGVQIDESSLSGIQGQINGLKLQPIKIRLDTSTVESQINSIKSKIEALKNIKIDFGVGRSRNGIASISQETAAYKQLLSVASQLDKLTLKTGGMKVAGADITEVQAKLTQLREKYQELYLTLSKGNLSQAGFKSLTADLSNTQAQLTSLEAKLVSMQSKLQANIQLKIDNGTLSGQISKIEAEFTALGVKSDEVSKHITTLKTLLGQMDGSDDIESVVADYETFKTTLTTVTNQVRELQREQKAANMTSTLEQSRTALSSQIDVWLKTNSAAAKQFGAQLQNIKAQIATADATSLSHLKAEFQEVTRQANLAGVATQSMGDKFRTQLSKLGTYFSASFVILRAIQTIKSAVNNVIELDTALVDLQKTSSATGEQLQEFYFSANETAKELGQTTQDVIQAAADWSRLGYSLEDSKKMAEVSSIFTSISPDLDMSAATDGLVSAMKAFHIEADEALDGIASKINIIGNTQAVSNGDIVEFLQKSSAAMANANNTLEETIALGTAATEITRDAANVGTMMKTISMRIRGYDEETEQYIGGIEELSGDIADLTKTASNAGGISLFTDSSKTEYKSTIQLLREINEIWDELTDKQQAQLTEKLGGKRGGQIIGSLMTNWEAVEKSLNTMSNSSGNAMNEMGIITESLEYKLNALKETAVGVSQNLFQRSDMSAIISMLTGLMSVLDFLTDKLGLFGTTLAGVIATLAIKKVGKDKMFSFSKYANSGKFSLGYQSFLTADYEIHDCKRNLNMLGSWYTVTTPLS